MDGYIDNAPHCLTFGAGYHVTKDTCQYQDYTLAMECPLGETLSFAPAENVNCDTYDCCSSGWKKCLWCGSDPYYICAEDECDSDEGYCD